MCSQSHSKYDLRIILLACLQGAVHLVTCCAYDHCHAMRLSTLSRQRRVAGCGQAAVPGAVEKGVGGSVGRGVERRQAAAPSAVEEGVTGSVGDGGGRSV